MSPSGLEHAHEKEAADAFCDSSNKADCKRQAVKKESRQKRQTVKKAGGKKESLQKKRLPL
jgi:hypothetical protein